MLSDRMLRCAWLISLLSASLPGQNVITTIAGIDSNFGGNGQPALHVPIGYINGVATDNAGNVYFTDPLEHMVLEVSANGLLTVVAGNGIAAYSGDGGPATSAGIAAFDTPAQYVGAPFEDSLGGIALDKQGNIYFGDGHYIRRVASDGTIATVAGGGTASPGDGGPAKQAALGIVNGLAFDAAGNLYFCESNRIRKLTPDGTLTTYAGGAANGFSGDGGPAVAALLSQPEGLAFDAQWNLFVADGDVANFPSRIREITTNGVITTIAGGGSTTPADGVAPLSMSLSYASGLAVDATSALYIFAPKNGYLLKITGGATTLITSTVSAAFKTDVPARGAFLVGQRVYDNSGIALDAAGNLYVADSRDGRLCKIDTQGKLTTLAGNGAYGYGGDGGPALGAMIQGPSGMTQTPDGTVYFLDTLNARVRAIAPNGTISTAISTSNFPPLGINELLNGITSDPSGNVYVLLAHRVIELTSTGAIKSIVNQAGASGTSGDGGPAIQATLQSGGGLARDQAGNFYVADLVANRIREVTVDGMIHTIAGTGVGAVSPDGAVASMSPIMGPTSVLPDGQGGLYFEEQQTLLPGGRVLRYITPNGNLKTIAGNLKGGFSGDGGPATQAGMGMQNRTGLALDALGNLLVADGFNHRVRVIAPNGTINTFAGSGKTASVGDGGLVQNAGFSIPRGLLFDSHGNMLISDVAANRIREVLVALPAITVAPSQVSFSADSGGARTPPQQLTIDGPVSGTAFSITASSGADWLIVGAGGFTPRLLNVRADPSNLAAGVYHATLTITAPLATPTISTVQITLNVSAGVAPVLAADRAVLSFTFPRNPPITGTQILRVSNQGGGSLSFTASAQTTTGGDWLSLGTASGKVTPQTPATVAVTVDPIALAAGTYKGTVTIASATTGTSIVIPVNLTVSTLDQAMRLSRPAMSFTAVAGGGVVPPGNFSVNNIGRGTMNFTVSTQTLSGGQQWLAATPASGAVTGGQTPANIRVTVDQTGLAPGFYFGLVRVDSATAANSPHIVVIALQVLPPDQDPGPVIEPSEIVFTAEQGAPPPGSRNLLVYNISGTPRTYISSVTSSDPNNQFSFRPGNSTLNLTHPTRIVVQPLTSGLAAGVYDAELTLEFSDGNVRRVGMRTIVTTTLPPLADTSAIPEHPAPRDTSVCTPTQLVPAITTLGQSFGVPAAWPVAIEAQVTDDCGNALNAGDVTASFSNGDPPLSLVAVQDGTWQSTWQSGNSVGPVTLTITATNAARNLTGTREVTGGLGSLSMAPVLDGAVSGASFVPNSPLSPGSMISLFGDNLGNGVAGAASLPLGTTLADATVVMAGQALPLLFGSSGQINAVVPAEINVNTSHQIVVQRGNTLSIPIAVDVGPANPGVFGFPLPGDPPRQGAIVNAFSYVVADPATPVTAGSVLAIFCTGLGAVDQTIQDGAAAPSSPLANTVPKATVTIGGLDAPVSFSGLSPGFAGLYQIDATVPSGVAAGNEVPVIVSIAGASSPAVTIAVK